MRLASHPLLDALCGEYLVGTLRGAARRRFESALRDEPLVALRLRHWQSTSLPRFSQRIEVQPPPHIWRKLEQDLDLGRYRQPWYRRALLWQAWAGLATAALVVLLVIGMPAWQPQPRYSEIARLNTPPGPAGGAGGERRTGGTQLVARLSQDGGTLVLEASRPVLAGPNQSYELWLIPAGAAPVSVAVLGSLDARVSLSAGRAAQLHAGVTLAVSTEPAGGSPTGQPTGAVILVGQVGT